MTQPRPPRARPRLTRRTMLTSAAAAAVGVAASSRRVAAAQGAAPALQRGIVSNMPFRALVRRGTSIGVEELRLRAITPRMVVVRTQAVAPCYTIVRGALGTNAAQRASVPNHCGFGVVEAIGGEVNRV